jgi:hypothetical protein
MTGQRPGPGSWQGKPRQENTDTHKQNNDSSFLVELLKTIQELLKTVRTFITAHKIIAGGGITIVIVLAIAATRPNPTPPSPPSPPINPVPSSELLSAADMEQAAGGSWQSDAADPQSGTCFSLPASPSKSEAVELSEALGARLVEVVDSFPTAEDASQAYTSFTSSENNCSFENTNKEGVTSQFTVVPDSNAPNLDSASSLWDVEGVPVALGGSPSHDGAVAAVRSGNLDAFAYIIVDTSNSPSMTMLENNIEPALARKL